MRWSDPRIHVSEEGWGRSFFHEVRLRGKELRAGSGVSWSWEKSKEGEQVSVGIRWRTRSWVGLNIDTQVVWDAQEVGTVETWEWETVEQEKGWWSIENPVGSFWQFNKIMMSKFRFSLLYQLVMDSVTTETFKQELVYPYKHRLLCGQTRTGDGSEMPSGIQGLPAFPLSHPKSTGLWLTTAPFGCKMATVPSEPLCLHSKPKKTRKTKGLTLWPPSVELRYCWLARRRK